MKAWPIGLVVAGIVGVIGVYFYFNRKKNQAQDLNELEFPDVMMDPSTPQTPPGLTAEQYEKFGHPYGQSYDNWLIHGGVVYKDGGTYYPPSLPLTTKTSDTTMIPPFSKEYIYYYPQSQLPEWLTPATFLRVQPPPIPTPQPWRYGNYYDQI